MAKIPVAQEQAAIYVQKDGYTLTLPLGEMYFLLTIREVPFAPSFSQVRKTVTAPLRMGRVHCMKHRPAPPEKDVELRRTTSYFLLKR